MSFTLNKIINLLKKKDILIQCNLSNDIIIEGVESLVNSKNNTNLHPVYVPKSVDNSSEILGGKSDISSILLVK